MTGKPSVRMRDRGRTFDPAIWNLVRSLPAPANYWRGRRMASGLTPDNILIFPSVPGRTPQQYGHYHPRFVLDVIQDHSGTLHLAGRDYLLHADECLLVFPHQFHHARAEEHPSPAGGWVVITFDLPDATAIETLRESPRRLRARERELLVRLVQVYRAGADGLEIAYSLARLLQALVRAPEIPPARRRLPTPDPRREAFMEQVHVHLRHTPTGGLSGLAKTLNMSEGRLRQTFLAYTGGSLADYARRNRLSQAARMLETSTETITEISARLGFSSAPAFSRMFKAAYGLPPKHYEGLIRRNAPRDT